MYWNLDVWQSNAYSGLHPTYSEGYEPDQVMTKLPLLVDQLIHGAVLDRNLRLRREAMC